jgi:hypothetical protein
MAPCSREQLHLAQLGPSGSTSAMSWVAEASSTPRSLLAGGPAWHKEVTKGVKGVWTARGQRSPHVSESLSTWESQAPPGR